MKGCPEPNKLCARDFQTPTVFLTGGGGGQDLVEGSAMGPKKTSWCKGLGSAPWHHLTHSRDMEEVFIPSRWHFFRNATITANSAGWRILTQSTRKQLLLNNKDFSTPLSTPHWGGGGSHLIVAATNEGRGSVNLPPQMHKKKTKTLPLPQGLHQSISPNTPLPSGSIYSPLHTHPQYSVNIHPPHTHTQNNTPRGAQ